MSNNSDQHYPLTGRSKENCQYISANNLESDEQHSKNDTVIENRESFSAWAANDSPTNDRFGNLPVMNNADDIFGKGLQGESLESDLLSESTINYFTDSELSNISSDKTCSPSQTTIAYWTQSVCSPNIDYAENAVDLTMPSAVENSSVQPNETKVIVTKTTLASVYGNQLSDSVDCQLICENTRCMMPISSPLDTGVDLHPLGRVLQQVGQSF